MDIMKPQNGLPEVRYKVGAQVRFTFGLAEVTGRVSEDRGKIGNGGRRLYGIVWQLDQEEPRYIELPAEEMRPVAAESPEP